MRLFFLFAVVLFSYFCSGQQNENQMFLDSLEQRLENIRTLEKEQSESETSPEKVDLLCKLSREHDGVDSIKTFNYANEALALSKQIGYKQGIADGNFTMGRALMYINPKEAIVYLEKGEELASKMIRRDSSEQLMSIWASGTYNLGLTYGYLGKTYKELELTEKIIPVVRKLEDSLFLANIYTNLGVQDLNLAFYTKAHKSLLKGREIYRLLRDPKQTTFNLIQLAMAEDGMDSLKMMKNSLDEAELLLKKYPDDFDKLNFGLEKSQYYIRKNEPDLALKEIDNIVGLVENDTSSVQYGIVMQRYARAYENKKDFTKARAYVTLYLNSAQKLKNNLDIYKGYYKRAQYHAATSNFQNAYEDLQEAVNALDTLKVIETKAKIDELNLKYEAARKEKELLAVKVVKEEKKSQGYLLGGISSLLALMVFTGYVFYQRQLSKAKKKERIQEAEVLLLKQNQQNKIFSAMIEGQEKERKRLAIDLHDGLGGRLSGISMNLSKLDKDEPKQYPKKKLQKVMKDLNDSLTELRSIARNMMPETLVKFGLQAALKDYCSSMTGSDTRVTLQFYGTDKGININQQVTMYRVIQELINNAIKHAKASEVLVQFMREENQVDITVEDNGVGFNKNESLKKKDLGMGLSNLQTRVAYLKGNIDFESEENEGTTVNVHLNIDAA